MPAVDLYLDSSALVKLYVREPETAEVAAFVADRALSAGFIINAPTPDALRLAPPLVITKAQVDEFVAALPSLLDGLEPTS